MWEYLHLLGWQAALLVQMPAVVAAAGQLPFAAVKVAEDTEEALPMPNEAADVGLAAILSSKVVAFSNQG